MVHDFLNHVFTKYPRKTIRLLEVIPPLISIFLITLPFWGAILFPVQLAYFIIFFDVYWLYKSINLVVLSFIAARKIKESEKADWLLKAEKKEHFSKLNHVIIMPTYKERIEKIKETIESIKNQTFPLSNIFIFAAFEEREKEAAEKSEIIEKEYKNIFGGIYSTFHPDKDGEVKGKSSNEAYAGRIAYEALIEKKKLDINYMTISSVDADSVFDSQYFANLSYRFLTSPSPHLRFWQSANVNYSNFWQVPTFTRIISFFGSLWRTSLLVQKLRLIPNSTYSLSFKLLKDIDFWDTDVIPEDYRIFFKAFFRTQGKVEVEPIYLKTSMDAPLSPTYFQSLVNKYNQERRWAWGISDDALYIKWWLTIKDTPFLKKTYLVINVLLDHILWPVNWFMITISANVVVLINPIFSRTTLGYNLPKLSGFILTICLFALLCLIFIDFSLRSKHYPKVPRTRQFIFLLEFIFMPIAGFFLSSFPALVSHIQLIRGKRLEYKVTEKS